jgi:hypothetical protein
MEMIGQVAAFVLPIVALFLFAVLLVRLIGPMAVRVIRAPILIALVVAGCGIGPSVSPRPATLMPATPLPSGYVTISTLSGQIPEGPNPACADVWLGNAFLHGDPTAGVPVWIVPDSHPDAEKVEVVWPFGFSARFTPDLELLDAHGVIIGREGYRLRDLAGRQDTPTRWVIWWVDGHGYDCW